jgi:putative oxidoreductase
MKLLTQYNTGLLSAGLFFQRAMIGLVFFVAGAGKAMGWFGGFGMKATLDIFRDQTHLSTFWIYVSCYTEFIGGFLLIIGLLTRPAALLLVINMAVAVYITGFANFFMGGAAYPCVLMTGCLLIVLAGPLAWSLDALLLNKKRIS